MFLHLKKITSITISSLLLMTVTNVYAVNDSKENVTAKWAASVPKVTTPYKTKPVISVTKPNLGELNVQFLEDGLNAFNFSRYLADLPDDVELDEALNKQAQYGSVLLASRAKGLSHTPEKPTGMPDDFYKKGYESTSSSNIAQGFDSIYDSIIYGYMNDGDETNLATLGHRRWILNPTLQKTGFGFAQSNDKQNYSATQVFDESRTENLPDNDYIAFPSNGVMPIEVFNEQYPWSISLNPDEYKAPNLATTQVKVTRIADNKSWQFSKKEGSSTDGDFYINNDAYGVANSIIFRPNYEKLSNGDTFQVKITGLQKKDGSKAEISYIVQFFQMVKGIEAKSTKQSFANGERKTFTLTAKLINNQTVDITKLATPKGWSASGSLVNISVKQGEIVATNSGNSTAKFTFNIAFGACKTSATFNVLPKINTVSVAANPFSDIDKYITGTATPNSYVTASLVSVNGKVIKIATVITNGQGKFSIPTKQSAGSKITLIATDKNAQSAPITITVLAKQNTASMLIIKTAVAKTGVITGTSNPNAIVTAIIGKGKYTVVAKANGDFTLKVPKQAVNTIIQMTVTNRTNTQMKKEVKMK